MAVAKFKQLWKNEYFQTAITILLVLAIVFGFWYGSQLVLNTHYPALAVASGSMCKLPGSLCDGWTHPFEPTLHKGDLIIVQGVSPADIRAEPEPTGDIIVFRKPGSSVDDLIVHRAIYSEVGDDGKIYFRTKGDGNAAADSHVGAGTWNGMISEEYLIGKVVMRIPWIGHLALFLHDSSGVYIIIVLIIIVLIAQFIIPESKKEKTETKPQETRQEISEPQDLQHEDENSP